MGLRGLNCLITKFPGAQLNLEPTAETESSHSKWRQNLRRPRRGGPTLSTGSQTGQVILLQGCTFSPAIQFDNGYIAYSFFDLIDSGPDTIFQSVIDQVFSTSKPICLVEKDLLASSPYYRGREGLDYGLQTMYWTRVADGVMEFGSTELIHPVHRKKRQKKRS